jgi:formate dehydrogenase major subunit
VKVSRRDFLQLTGSTVVLSAIGIDDKDANAQTISQELKTKDAVQTTTVCPFCAVGCGIVVHTKDGKVINAEGDSEHPINNGALCPKGASLYQYVNNPLRLTKPRYRGANEDSWKEVEWSWALDAIAKRVKTVRDKTFIVNNGHGQVVNRCDGIAHVGSSSLDNEECYVLQKWLRSLGLVYIDHQARI